MSTIKRLKKTKKKLKINIYFFLFFHYIFLTNKRAKTKTPFKITQVKPSSDIPYYPKVRFSR